MPVPVPYPSVLLFLCRYRDDKRYMVWYDMIQMGVSTNDRHLCTVLSSIFVFSIKKKKKGPKLPIDHMFSAF